MSILINNDTKNSNSSTKFFLQIVVFGKTAHQLKNINRKEKLKAFLDAQFGICENQLFSSKLSKNCGNYVEKTRVCAEINGAVKRFIEYNKFIE